MVRKRRRYERDIRLCAALLIFAILWNLVTAIGRKPDYDAFLSALAMRESSCDDSAVNQYGYLGRYQLGSMALEDAGFLAEDGTWTDLAAAYQISSNEDFLNSPEGQTAAVTAYHTKLCGYIRSYGLEEYIGKTYCGIRITRSGLLASCHLVGVGAMAQALEADEPVFDGNRVPAEEYMELFSGYDISRVWNGKGGQSMSGEEIFGLIIMVGSCWLCAATISAMGIWGLKRRKPMHFWSGTAVDPKTISDIPAYNRENARMWFVYSGFFWISGIVSFFHTIAAMVIMMLACFPGILFLVRQYNRIYSKYRVP